MLVPVLAISILLVLTPVYSGEQPPDGKDSPPQESTPPAPAKDDKENSESPAPSKDGEDKNSAGEKKNLARNLLSAAVDYSKGKERPKLEPQELDAKDPKQAAGLLATEVIGVASDQAKKAIESNADAIIVPENFNDHKDVEILKIFSALYKERRRLKIYMFLHATTSFIIGILTYFLRSNVILVHVAAFMDDHNESWGANIEALWINHQEKMADFLLRLMEKKKIDPKKMAGKKMKVEYKHKKFATVPVFRTYPEEPLPDDAKNINNNKVNLWKNMMN